MCTPDGVRESRRCREPCQSEPVAQARALARNFAIRAISVTGTGSSSGNRIVPLLIV
jgi:hypothetical protein